MNESPEPPTNPDPTEPDQPVEPEPEPVVLTDVMLTLEGGAEIESFRLTEGEHARLFVVTQPSDVAVAEVIWEENEFVQIVEKDNASALYQAVKHTNGEVKVASVKAKAAEGDYVVQEVKFEILRFIPALQSLEIVADKSLDDPNYQEKIQLTAVPTPSDAEYDAVVWSSSNTGIADVDANGLVTVLNGGLAVVTATAGEVTGKVEIRSRHYALTGFTVTDSVGSSGPYNLKVGDQIRLFATPQPAQADFNDIRWGENEYVKLVSADGVSAVYEAIQVTASETVIPVQAASVHNYYSSTSLRFNIAEPAPEIEPIPDLTGIQLQLSEDLSNIGYMGQAQVIAQPVPTNAALGDLTWTSSNPSAVDVSPTGVITMKNAGQAQITATSGSISQSVVLSSNYYALEGVSVATEAGATGTIELEPGTQIKLVATPTPSQAVTSYQWDSNQYVSVVAQEGNTATYEAIEVTEKVTTDDLTTVAMTATGAYGGSATASITFKVPKVK